MKLLLLLPLLLLLLLLPFTTSSITCSNTCTANNPSTHTTTAAASRGITDIAIKLLQEYGAQRNYMISPYSIWTLLGLVMVGAEGNTETQMAKVLGVNNKIGVLSLLRNLANSLESQTASDGNVSIDIANRIYTQQGFQIKNCQAELSNLLVPIDLSQGVPAAKTINGFVNETTRGLIKEIISPDKLGADTRMVALNAIYFKGSWRYPFAKESTAPGPFYETPGANPVNVEMMFRPEMPVMLGYSAALSAQVLQLNYSTGIYSFTILLPSDSGDTAMNNTLQALNSTSLWEALNNVQLNFYDVMMPKFEIKSKFEEDLKMALQKMGIQDLFDSRANLSSFRGDLYVKHIMHKTFVKVDEEGTEAAAATGAVLAIKIRRSIRINRPFFFIIHDGDTILFIGTYRKP